MAITRRNGRYATLLDAIPGRNSWGMIFCISMLPITSRRWYKTTRRWLLPRSCRIVAVTPIYVSEVDYNKRWYRTFIQAFEPHSSASFDPRIVSWRKPVGDGMLMAISVRQFYFFTVPSRSQTSFCLLVRVQYTRHLVLRVRYSCLSSHALPAPLLLFPLGKH